MGSLKAMWLQCGITAALACVGYLWSVGELPKTRLVIAMAMGFGGNYLLMKLYVWGRFGWKAMRSMRMYGND